ncbi:MAG: membrane protein insertion efficiency factor YidD, partial [Desulfobacterales bacterium]
VPSCSAYGKQAIKKHGVALGTIMTAARLTHERGEMRFSPMVKTAKGYRFYDPVENNDFWFSGSSGGLPAKGTPNE